MTRYFFLLVFFFLFSCKGDRKVFLDPPVLGCTSVDAVNFNSNATEDDGSCVFVGCTDPVATNYNPEATVNDGSCFYDNILIGCIDSTMFNYNPLAVGCGDPPNPSSLDCCVPFIYGCTDVSALNYDATANTNQVDSLDDSNPCCYVSGCTNSLALNYNPEACFDDGSCVFSEGVSFSNDVMPIFNDRCVECHGIGTPYPLQLEPENLAWGELMSGSSAEGEPYINGESPEDSYLYLLINGGVPVGGSLLVMP